MKTKRLKVPKVGWRVTYFFDVTTKDIPEVMSEMDNLGMPYRKMKETRHTIEDEGEHENWGYTIYDPYLKTIISICGKQSDFKQLINTSYHEQNHVVGIISYYEDLQNGEEKSAHISGALAEHFADVIASEAMEFYGCKNKD